MRSQFIEVNGYNLHIVRSGQGKQTLLFVHGYTDSAACWQSLIEKLAPDYDVVAYDSRGHGQSGRIQGDYTISDLADECIGVIETLGLEQPILIGHSMGAGIAAFVALRVPHLIRAVLLEDPPFVETVLISVPDMQEWKARLQQQKETPDELVTQYYRTVLFPTWSDTDIATRVEARNSLDLAVFDHMDWAASPRWQDWADQVTAVGLLLTGDPDLGAIVKPEVATEITGKWTALEHIHIGDIGHHIRCSASETYWFALTHFLQEYQCMSDFLKTTPIDGVLVAQLKAFGDERGRFMETFRREWFPQVSWDKMQSNRSESKSHVLRGLHYHFHQVDYWFCAAGHIRAGLVDLRPSSPTYNVAHTVEMGDEHLVGLFIPVGVAHGFYAITACTLFYTVNNYYDGKDEFGVAWDDPSLGLDWGVKGEPLLSPRDAGNKRLAEMEVGVLPK